MKEATAVYYRNNDKKAREYEKISVNKILL